MSASTVIALLLAAAAGKAGGEVVGVLAIAPPPGPNPELAKMTERLRDELSTRMPGVLTSKALSDRMRNESGSASLAELDRAFAGALEAAKTDPGRATSWLREIVAELERQPDGPETFQQWTRATLRLARLRMEYISSPDDVKPATAEARTLLRRVLRADPKTSLDPELYPRRMIALADEVAAELKAAPVRQITFKSSAPKTRIFVDGREVGAAPVTIPLSPGTYRVSGTDGSVRTAPAQVVVGDGPDVVTLDLSLPASFRPDSGPGLALTIPEQEQRSVLAAGALGLDRVVLTKLVDVEGIRFLSAQVVQVKPLAESQRQGWIRVGAGSAFERGYAALADFLATGQPNPQVETQPQRPADPLAARRTGGWVLLGAGVAAIGTSVYFGLQSRALAADFRQLPQTDPSVSSVASRGRTYSIVADVGLLVGILAGGAGGYFAFAPAPQAPPGPGPHGGGLR